MHIPLTQLDGHRNIVVSIAQGDLQTIYFQIPYQGGTIQ